MLDSGNAGYLERDGKRIYLSKWEIHDDNSLKLWSTNTIFKKDKKRENPIFEGTNVGYCVNEGTNVVLAGGSHVHSRRTTLSEKTRCICYGDSQDVDLTRIEFDDVSLWSFSD
jgi:hypothetical protein